MRAVPFAALQGRGKSVGVESTAPVLGVCRVVGRAFHHPYGLGVFRADDIGRYKEVGVHGSVQVLVGNVEVLAGGAGQPDAEAVFHHRPVREHFLGIFGRFREVFLLVVFGYAQSQVGLGKEERGGPFAGTSALFLGQGGGELVVSGLEVVDGGLVGLGAGDAVIAEAGDLGILEHDRNAAVQLGQTQIADAAQEERLGLHAGHRALGGPFDLIHLAEGQVGVGDDLVELVPELLGDFVLGGPGSLDVAHVGGCAQLVFSVEDVGAGGLVEADAHAGLVGEGQFAHVVIAGEDGIDNLVAGLEGVQGGDAVLHLLREEFIVAHAPGCDDRQQGTGQYDTLFHCLQN